jgi:thiol-disulfide isomerase/thioredoxin
MKSTLLFFAFATLFCLAQEPKPAPEPKLPRKAENIGIQVAPDKYLWLSDYSGKTCVMAFILTTCPHCQFTVGLLNRIQKDYAGKDVQVIASAIEPMSSLNIPSFTKTFQVAFPVGYNDQRYIAKFLGRGPDDPLLMPQLVFVDRNGVIRAQLSGEDAAMNKDIQDKSLRETLEKTMKEGAGKK